MGEADIFKADFGPRRRCPRALVDIPGDHGVINGLAYRPESAFGGDQLLVLLLDLAELVERTDELSLEGIYYPVKGFWAGLKLSRARVENELHQPALDCWKTYFDLKIGYTIDCGL